MLTVELPDVNGEPHTVPEGRPVGGAAHVGAVHGGAAPPAIWTAGPLGPSMHGERQFAILLPDARHAATR